MTRKSCAPVLVLVSIVTGCGTNPAAPTPATSITPQLAAQVDPLATLVIRDFSVTEGTTESGRYHYWPKLTVAETSGASVASITASLSSCSTLARPAASLRVESFVVQAAGTLSLVEDSWIRSWFGIDGRRTRHASRSCSPSSTAPAGARRSARSRESRDSRARVERRPLSANAKRPSGCRRVHKHVVRVVAADRFLKRERQVPLSPGVRGAGAGMKVIVPQQPVKFGIERGSREIVLNFVDPHTAVRPLPGQDRMSGKALGKV